MLRALENTVCKALICMYVLPSKVGNELLCSTFFCCCRSKAGNNILGRYLAAAGQQYLLAIWLLPWKVGSTLCARNSIHVEIWYPFYGIALSLTLSAFISFTLCMCVLCGHCARPWVQPVWPLGPGQRHRPLTFIFMANAKRQRHLLNFLCFRKFTFMFSSLLILLSLPLLLADCLAGRQLGIFLLSCLFYGFIWSN